jgi:hypothetical protein
MTSPPPPASAEATPPEALRREVVCGDALEWLRLNPARPGCSVLTTMPDVTECGVPYPEWRRFFLDAARLALLATPEDGLTLFFQTDNRLEGRWVSKAAMVLQVIDELEVPLLWHKIVCRKPPGTVLLGRPGYSHILAASRGRVMPAHGGFPDVLPDLGEMPWSHSMGTRAAELCIRAIRVASPSTHTVVVPFCGIGTALAMANDHGLACIGLERNRKRAEKAKTFQLGPPLGPPVSA